MLLKTDAAYCTIEYDTYASIFKIPNQYSVELPSKFHINKYNLVLDHAKWKDADSAL